MHRLILLSSTYRQSSWPNERAAQVDPGNRLLWRMPRRRLEAESLRDALLAVAGNLDRNAGGPDAAEALWKRAEIIDAKRGFAANRMQTNDPFYDTPRRSVYLPVVRNGLPDVLSLFDAADPNGVSATRNETTVPAQSLFMLNNPFVRSQALQFANSLLRDAGADDRRRIRLAYLRALGRPPTEAEVDKARLSGCLCTPRQGQRRRPAGGVAELLPDAVLLQRVSIRRLSPTDAVYAAGSHCRQWDASWRCRC